MGYDERQLVKVAMLYYLEGLDQAAIASRLGLSRQSVSRHLKSARDQGIIQFSINSPVERSFAEIELELEMAYGLKAAVVAPVEVESDERVKDALGRYAARFLEQSVRAGVLGVSWSSTVLSCALHLRACPVEGLTICQLNGSTDVADFSTRAEFIISKMAAAFGTKSISLAAPMLVDSAAILDSIVADSRIRNSLEVAKAATMGIFGIGSINHESSLYQTGYVSEEMLTDLVRRGAVGDIAGHFFDAQGEICDESLEARTLAVPQSTFRSMGLSIALAGGGQKLEAIKAALAGRWCNVLVTDELTARSLLAGRGGQAR